MQQQSENHDGTRKRRTDTPLVSEVKKEVDAAIERLSSQLRELNHKIWSQPELAYHEYAAHDTICTFLEAEGFAVTRHAYGLETSFEARSGSGGRLVNFNAEYDALPDIGHACGHNLIATGSITAFLGLSFALKKLGRPGRTQLLGTPAEENGGGKIKLIDAGAYEGVDASLMAHSGPYELFPNTGPVHAIGGVRMNARTQIHGEFFGRSAHAGGNPWDGVNALDALVSAYNNTSVLRQQIRPEERIHCAILSAPTVANIIPAYTKAFWQVRSPTLKGLDALVGRVKKCVEAGAMAAGCEVKVHDEGRYNDVVLNETLCELFRDHMAAYGKNALKDHPDVVTASSDIGNVSYVVPTLHAMFGITEKSFPHHPVFAAEAGTDGAHEETLVVGKAMAMAGYEILANDGLFEAATEQWKRAVADAQK